MNKISLYNLIVRAKQKDREAIIKLYRVSCDKVYFYCFKILGEPANAAAAVYEIFFRLFKDIDKIDSAEDYNMELNSIMVQICKAGPDKTFDLSIEEDIFAAEAGYEPKNSDIEQLIEKIDSLPERQKRIAILFHYEKLTPEQISEIEGISEDAVQDELNKLAEAICAGQNRTITTALENSAAISYIPEIANKWIIEKLTDAAGSGGKNIYSRLKKPVFLKVRVWHLIAAVLILVVILLCVCLGHKAQTVPTEAGDCYMTISMADFPEEIREQAAFYSTGFYDNADFEVTPEMAYIRTAGGYRYYEDNWLDPIEENIEICWYGNNTNVLCLFNKDKDPIAYLYGFAEDDTDPETYPKELEVHTGFKIDGKAVMDKAVSDAENMMKNIYTLDEDDICIRYSEANEAYVFDINYDSVPFTKDEVTRDKILYTDLPLSEAKESFAFVLSQYWLGEGRLMGEEPYNKKDRGLNKLGYGQYYVLNRENFYDKILVAVYSGEKLIAAGCLDAEKMDIPDYEN